MMNRGRLVVIFAVAVVVNFGWELAQARLYAGVEFPGALGHCFIAALGDGVLVLLIYATVAVVRRSPEWYLRPETRSYVAMAAAGLVLGIAVEWWGLHVARRWQYSALMPIAPGLGIGAVPLLQMLLLPPAIFGIARRALLSRK